ncbi:6-bladed beta-propeller [uncultured Duncaniella sp.]|uniref:6-bladed beta-propeller n=2 Tax=uncultured Duncaniella sp. TaxID=2768039 RepID=UPI00261D4904|nr:6-bladed beta-propeller [uncultured Duncaniella sp.]
MRLIFFSFMAFLALTVTILLPSCSEGNNIDGSIPTVDLTGIQACVRPVVTKEIELKTDSPNPIGDITKLICLDSCFFIMDRLNQTVWKFNESGHLLGKLRKVGATLGEYVDLYDMDLLPDGDLYLMDLSMRKIIRYDSDSFNLVSEIKIPGTALAFSAVDSTKFVFNNAGDKDGININLGIFKTSANNIKPCISAKQKDEYLALGANTTHLWRSGNEIIYYDRFTPDFYLLTADSVLPYFSLLTEKIPTESQVENMIKATRGHDFSSAGMDGETIIDILYAYKNSVGLLFGLNTTPQQHIFQRFDNGKTYLLGTSDSPTVVGMMRGAVGVFGDSFVTVKLPSNDDENPSLILYSLDEI